MQHFPFKSNGTSVPFPKTTAQKAPDALFRQCLAMNRNGQTQKSLELLRKARETHQTDFRLDTLIAETEFQRGNYIEAIEAYQNVLRFTPTDHKVFMNIGVALQALDRKADASTMFATALKISPNYTEAKARKARLDLTRSDWSEFGEIEKSVADFKKLKAGFTPGSFLALADDPSLQKKVCESFVSRVYNFPKSKRPSPRMRLDTDKIRIGYFSCDFHRHATMHLMIRMLELHNKDRFEVHFFDYTTAEEIQPWTDRIRATACKHHPVADMLDSEIAALAQAEGIDIAIDLKGHTKNGRPQILMYQPAPVSVSYLGHPGTLGMKSVDYIVADPVVIPEPLQRYYSEKIIYMPDSYQVTDNTRKIAETIPTRAALGLPEDAVVFCCFNANYKITPKEFDIWMRVMAQIDGSVLWLWSLYDDVREKLRSEAQARGIAPDRLIFAESLGQEEHLARIQAADLFLDTFNYCAHTTASDALWAGLPLVTLEGQQFSARVASSILHAMEMPELVTHTPEEYEALILDLAQNPDKLSAVRAKIAQKRDTAPMFDTERFTRNWEHQLEQALLRCERGLKPDHLML